MDPIFIEMVEPDDLLPSTPPPPIGLNLTFSKPPPPLSGDFSFDSVIVKSDFGEVWGGDGASASVFSGGGGGG